MSHWTDAQLSTFADPDDVDAFRRCKRRGGTDVECFAVGDNGVGCWGDDTTSTLEYFVALHHDDMVARWGTLANSKHRLIRVRVGEHEVLARIGDRTSERGRVDANPACQITLRVLAGSLVPCRWQWAE